MPHLLRRAARILLIGAPGSGKGTQLHRLPTLFPQLNPLSTGDLLRAEIRARTPLGLFAEGLINKGNILPDATVTSLILNEALQRGWATSTSAVDTVELSHVHVSDPGHVKAGMVEVQDSTEHSFLLDGFPRTASQARLLHEAGLKVNLVLLLDIPMEVLLSRMAGRLVHPPSGRVYNLNWLTHPTKNVLMKPDPEVEGGFLDIETGEKLVRREDDDVETVRRRLEGHERRNGDIVRLYEEMGVLRRLKAIEGEEVTPEIEGIVKEMFC